MQAEFGNSLITNEVKLYSTDSTTPILVSLWIPHSRKQGGSVYVVSRVKESCRSKQPGKGVEVNLQMIALPVKSHTETSQDWAEPPKLSPVPHSQKLSGDTYFQATILGSFAACQQVTNNDYIVFSHKQKPMTSCNSEKQLQWYLQMLQMTTEAQRDQPGLCITTDTSLRRNSRGSEATKYTWPIAGKSEGGTVKMQTQACWYQNP